MRDVLIGVVSGLVLMTVSGWVGYEYGRSRGPRDLRGYISCDQAGNAYAQDIIGEGISLDDLEQALIRLCEQKARYRRL